MAVIEVYNNIVYDLLDIAEIDADIASLKEKGFVSVVLPLRDRNGDSIAAVRVIMKRSAGQNEQHAFARAQPVIQEMQSQLGSLQDLVQ